MGHAPDHHPFKEEPYGEDYFENTKTLEGRFKNEFVGKWIFFVPEEDVESVEDRIEELFQECKLGFSYKIEPPQGKHSGYITLVCLYLRNYKEMAHVIAVAEVLLSEGFIEKYGVRHKDESRAIYFKPNIATDIASVGKGKNLTLYKYTTNHELFVKARVNGKMDWKKVEGEVNEEDYLDYIQFLRNQRRR